MANKNTYDCIIDKRKNFIWNNTNAYYDLFHFIAYLIQKLFPFLYYFSIAYGKDNKILEFLFVNGIVSNMIFLNKLILSNETHTSRYIQFTTET